MKSDKSNATWEDIDELLKKEEYRKQIQKLSTETLQFFLEEKNDAKINEHARNAIKELEPDKLTDEHIAEVASGMKRLAKLVVEKRSKK